MCFLWTCWTLQQIYMYDSIKHNLVKIKGWNSFWMNALPMWMIFRGFVTNTEFLYFSVCIKLDFKGLCWNIHFMIRDTSFCTPPHCFINKTILIHMHIYASCFYKVCRKTMVCKIHSIFHSEFDHNNRFIDILIWKNLEGIFVSVTLFHKQVNWGLGRLNEL